MEKSTLEWPLNPCHPIIRTSCSSLSSPNKYSIVRTEGATVISQCSECLIGTIQTRVVSHASSIKFPLQTYKQCSFLTPFDKVLTETQNYIQIWWYFITVKNYTACRRELAEPHTLPLNSFSNHFRKGWLTPAQKTNRKRHRKQSLRLIFC